MKNVKMSGVKMMEWKQFSMVLMAMLVLTPAAFADGNANTACPDSHQLYVGGFQEHIGSYVVRLDDVTATATGVSAVATILSPGVPLTQLTVPMQTAQTYTTPGGQTITLGVCDASLGSGSGTSGKWATLTYAISSTTNQPPAITTLGGSTSLAVGQTGTWMLAATDPNDINLQYTALWGDGASKPAASFTTFQQSYMYHAYSQAGTYTVTVTVTDAAGASTQASITTTVTGSSSQPDLSVYAISISTANGITKVTPTIKNVGSATASGYTITYYLDGTAVTVQESSTHLAAGASETNELDRGQIPAGQHTMRVAITSSDSGANNANNEMTKTFEISGSNQPPVITSTTGPSTLSTNQKGTWTVSAYDPDGTYLSYSVNWGEGSNAPVSSNDLGRTGSSASFEHAYSQAGMYMITFTVKDAQVRRVPLM